MAKFEDEDYFEILVAAITSEKGLPFDVYVLLPKMARIIIYNEKNIDFNAVKFKKIIQKKVKKLYVRNLDKELYFDFLNGFFKNTEEGQSLKKEILQSDDLSKFSGLPSQEDFELFGLDPPAPVTGAAETTEDNGEMEEDSDASYFAAFESMIKEPEAELIKAEEPDENLIQEDNDDASYFAAFESIIQERSSENIEIKDKEKQKLSKSYGEVIANLSEEVSDLGRILGINSELNSDDKIIISDVTEKILLDIQVLTGEIHGEKDVEKIVIKDCTERIQNNMKLILESLKMDDPKFEFIKGYTDGLKEHTINILKTLEPKVFDEKLQSTALYEIDNLRAETEHIRGMAFSKPDMIIVRSLRNMVDSVDGILGGDFRTQIIKEAKSLDQNSGITIVKGDRENKLEFLKELIKSQNDIITKLGSKLNCLSESLERAVKKWILFEVQIKRTITPQDQIVMKSLSKDIREANLDQRDNVFDYNELVKINKKTCEPLKIRATATRLKSLDGEDVDTRPAEKESWNQAEINERNSTEQEIRENKKSGSSEEDDILRIQLENTQGLLESRQTELLELQKVLEKHNDYTHALEEENDSNKKTIAKLEEEVSLFEKDQMRRTEALAETEKVINQSRVEITSYQNQVRDLLDRVDSRQALLEALKQAGPGKSEKVVKELKEKSDRVQKLEKEIDLQTRELLSERLEHEKTKTMLSSLSSEKESSEKKYEKLKSEVDGVIRKNRLLEIKAETANVSLQNTRDATIKLGKSNEELRKDRQKYIQSTNESLNKFKDIANKALSLTNEVDVAEQKVRRMKEQNERLKSKEFEAKNIIKQQLEDINNLIQQNKNLTLQIKDSDSGTHEKLESTNKQLKDTKSKLDRARQEQQELSVKFAQEQRITKEMKSTIKGLETKLTRLAVAAKKKNVA